MISESWSPTDSEFQPLRNLKVTTVMLGLPANVDFSKFTDDALIRVVKALNTNTHSTPRKDLLG